MNKRLKALPNGKKVLWTLLLSSLRPAVRRNTTLLVFVRSCDAFRLPVDAHADPTLLSVALPTRNIRIFPSRTSSHPFSFHAAAALFVCISVQELLVTSPSVDYLSSGRRWLVEQTTISGYLATGMHVRFVDGAELITDGLFQHVEA